MTIARKANHDASNCRIQVSGLFWLGVLCVWLTCGCAHTDRSKAYDRGGTATLLPRLTALTAGPIAVLLTHGNTNTYSATFSLTSSELSGKPLRLSGPLLGSGQKLRLEFAKSDGKPLLGGTVDLIWDGATRQGYLLSEAMRSYAPVYDVVRCTNLLTGAAAGPTGRMEGHPADTATATLQCGDGQTITIQLTRALDLGKLPLQLHFADQPDSFALTLSKIRADKLPDDLFLPPDDFTKYPTAVAMIDELAARQQSVYSEHGHHFSDDKTDPNAPAVGGHTRMEQ